MSNPIQDWAGATHPTLSLDFYQVLDPPAMAEVMAMDLYTKPNAYRELGSIANRNYGDAFYYSRNNLHDYRIIASEGSDHNGQGITKYFDNFGLAYVKGAGRQSTSQYQQSNRVPHNEVCSHHGYPYY